MTLPKDASQTHDVAPGTTEMEKTDLGTVEVVQTVLAPNADELGEKRGMKKPLRDRSAHGHFLQCTPFCSHVEFCRDCMDIHWFCPKHRTRPALSIKWKYGEARRR